MRGIASRRLIYLPLVLSAFIVAWTICVSPLSEYGDSWAIWPVLLTLPLILITHAALLLSMPDRLAMLIYASIHVVVGAPIWLLCLMRISKDAL